jgi:hypothetical protein
MDIYVYAYLRAVAEKREQMKNTYENVKETRKDLLKLAHYLGPIDGLR